MGNYILRYGKAMPRLEKKLRQSRIRMRSEEYLACVWTSVLVAGIVSAAIGILLEFSVPTLFGISTTLAVITSISVIILPPVLIAAILMIIPSSRARARGRDIDRRIGPAMSFISAMASANVNVDAIFKELAKQDIYGEIKKEAKWITRDTELLGIDIFTAISHAAQRTPSIKFQEFLQGVITTATSGGDLKPYFLQKAEQFEKESKLEAHSQLKSLGLLAETFVIIVVAFPLFLVIIMTIMAIIPGSGGNVSMTVLMLKIVIIIFVPLSQFSFIYFAWNSARESAL